MKMDNQINNFKSFIIVTIKRLKPFSLYPIPLTLLLLAFGFLLLASEAEAAKLYFKAQRDTAAVGESRLVELRLDSEGEYINAGEITITYPSSLLRAANLFEGGSIFDVFITRPKVIKEGEIFLEGGASDAFNGDGLLLTIAFAAKGEGQALVNIATDSEILIADGQGTPAQLTLESARLSIISAQAGSEISGSGIYTPKISSPTHSDETKFSTSSQVVITWTLHDDFDYSYTFSNEVEVPDDIPEERVSSVSFFDLKDGIYFFNLKPINRATGQVSPVVTFRVMIDTTPPSPLKLSVGSGEAEGTSLVAVKTSDNLSGIEAFEFKTPEQQEFQRSDSPYFVIERGDVVTVRVYDKAGNVVEKTFRLNQTPQILIFGLIVIIALLIGFIIRLLIERQRSLSHA